MGTIKQLIKDARTHRWYQDRHVDTSEILDVIETARYAAQARNIQKIRFAIINDDKEMVNQIFNLTNLPLNHGVPSNEQPQGYIVFTHEDAKVANKDLHNMNLGIIFQNINLLLAEKGIRCVYIYSANKDKTRDIIGLDESYKVDFVVGYGYPFKEVRTVDTNDEESQPVFKDEDGIHTVSKLTTDKLVVLKK